MSLHQELRPLLCWVRIAHHLPGRIRLKMDERALTLLPRLGRHLPPLPAVVAALPGVRTVDVNALARSCTVHYDPQRIPAAGWEAWLAGRSDEDAQVFEALLRQAQAVLFPVRGTSTSLNPTLEP